MKHLAAFHLLMLLSAATASAQTSFSLGPRAGLNRAVTTLSDASTSTGSQYFNYSAEKSAVYAWQAGGVLEIAFSKFAIQPALLFSQKGEHLTTTIAVAGTGGFSTSTQYSANRYYWLELPVNFVYSVHDFQLFAGPYVAIAVGGQYQSTSYYDSPNTKSIPRTYDGKIHYNSFEDRRLDAGLNLGVGYRKGPLQVQLGYAVGLLNLKRNPIQVWSAGPFHNFEADPAYNRVAQLTGAYFFKL
jgi:hypothetical protein